MRHQPWIVPTYMAPTMAGSSPASRSASATRILMDSAAFSVKVKATIPRGCAPFATSNAMR